MRKAFDPGSVEISVHNSSFGPKNIRSSTRPRIRIRYGAEASITTSTSEAGMFPTFPCSVRSISASSPVLLMNLSLPGWPAHSSPQRTIHSLNPSSQPRPPRWINEWMVRCGLEWAGHPGKDKFINNTGDEAEMDLTLHGKVGNIPASEVEVVIDASAPYRIRIRGRVDERMFYGPKLELWTEISTEPGSNALRIEDEVKNYSAYDQEFQIIYHSNYGPPLLEAGSRFVVAAKEVRPFNAHAAKSLNQFAEYVAPTKGFIEQVYGVIPFADENNRASVMLRNAASDKGVTMSYLVDQLPYFTLWKNTTAIEEGYVTGLEPGTGFPANRSVERKAGRVPKLKPNETRKFAIDFAILAGKEQVDRAGAVIAGFQNGRQTQFNPQPIRPEGKD